MTIVTETYNDEFEQSREMLVDNIVACRLRLTAVTNAAAALLRVVNDLVIDLPTELTEYDADIDKLRRDLNAAINVARGGSEKLPKELFNGTADRPALIRAGERLGLL